ncbi:MAG: hypothetical protein R3A10_14385 [Caldilineaceae bacterium]
MVHTGRATPALWNIAIIVAASAAAALLDGLEQSRGAAGRLRRRD